MPNGIDLILEDHQRVDALFAQFIELGDASFVGQIIDALTAHDDVEHGALYPLIGTVIGDAAMIERAAAAHSAVKKQIDLLVNLEGPPLTAAIAVLQSLVAEHVNDEETNLLPALSEQASTVQLETLGARILQIKQRIG